ncbi:MAG: hypothetical protein JWM98_811 [Thermoleophilia bacterium]|nr:hypothetical protein [Thermoleophilia bacterium]
MSPVPRYRIPALALLVGALCAVAAGGGDAAGATSGTVVGATVPSSTTLDVSACLPGSVGRTDLGTIMPGSSSISSIPCDIRFGSSNDSSNLRVSQTDGFGAAMVRLAVRDVDITGTSTDNLRKVDALPGGRAWTTGYTGRILRSDDFGASWTAQSSGIATHIHAIDAVDPSTAWAVGDSGRILRTVDGGATWTIVPPGPLSGTLRSVAAVSANEAYVVGNSGLAYRTPDAGATWTSLALGTGSTAWDVKADGRGGVWVTAGTRVYRSSDDGVTIASVVPGGSLLALELLDADSLLGVGTGGTIYRSDDSGATWAAQSSGTASTLWELTTSSATHAVAVGDGGVILRTTDGGATWVPVPSPTTKSLRGVAAVDDATFVIASDGGGTNGQVLTSASNPVPEPGSGGSWTAPGGGMFAACLLAADGGATTDPSSWQATGSCGANGVDPWRAVPSSAALPAALIAHAPSGTTTARARLDFGMRVEPGRVPGSYLAPVTFTVVAPDA